MQLSLPRLPAFTLRPDVAQASVATLAMLIALGLLGWVLAYWTWAWFSPQTEARVDSAVVSSGRPEVAYELFGQAQQVAAASGDTISLLGVIAEAGKGDSYAILRYADQPVRPVRKGSEVAPGVRLSEVYSNKVVVERGGIAETIALPEKRQGPPAAPGNQ